MRGSWGSGSWGGGDWGGGSWGSGGRRGGGWDLGGHHGGGRSQEAWRAREGHPDGPRRGDRGGRRREWYSERSRAERQGPDALEQWLRDNPRPQ